MPVLSEIYRITVPGLYNLVQSNQKLRENIDDLMFISRGSLENVNWSKAKVFVPCDPTAVPWIKIALSELPQDVNFTTALLGGNNGKYGKKSFETSLARLMCIFNGYKLKPFVSGIESEIISDMVKDVIHGPVELEKQSSNTKANWENAWMQGMLDGVETIIVVYFQEGVARHIGTLKATLIGHGLDPEKYNIIAWPYTPTISSDNWKLFQQYIGFNVSMPNGLVVCDKDNWDKSAWGVGRTIMEFFSIKKWSEKGHVYLTDEQKKLVQSISDKIKPTILGPAIVKAQLMQNQIISKMMGKEGNQRD